MNYQSFITTVLKDTSEIANKKFGKVSGTIKGSDSNQVLTEADIAIGAYIIQKIKQEYPEYNIIDEEAGIIDNKSEFTWVIDPIDGTSNFANGVPTYGIMIGLLQKNIPIAGGIALPAFNNIVIAEKGEGAFSMGEKISVTEEPNLLNCLVAYHIDSHREDPQMTKDECNLIADIILNIRNLRSSSSVYDGVLVATGQYGGILNRTTKIWDNIALHIVIEEAGGVYTDFFGKQMEYTNPLVKAKDNFTFCAASPVLHKQLQNIIHDKK